MWRVDVCASVTIKTRELNFCPFTLQARCMHSVYANLPVDVPQGNFTESAKWRDGVQPRRWAARTVSAETTAEHVRNYATIHALQGGSGEHGQGGTFDRVLFCPDKTGTLSIERSVKGRPIKPLVFVTSWFACCSFWRAVRRRQKYIETEAS